MSKTFEQKQDEKLQSKQGEWPMIKLIQKYIMAYAIFDFTFQIVCQMPTMKFTPFMEVIGLRKVWIVRSQTGLNYSNLINHLDNDESSYQGFELDKGNLYLQCINCVMIAILSL
jgi:hypothetical protein